MTTTRGADMFICQPGGITTVHSLPFLCWLGYVCRSVGYRHIAPLNHHILFFSSCTPSLSVSGASVAVTQLPTLTTVWPCLFCRAPTEAEPEIETAAFPFHLHLLRKFRKGDPRCLLVLVHTERGHGQGRIGFAHPRLTDLPCALCFGRAR